ncbi:hypothetical protein [Gloeocapsopsis dulcis]|nr:hypothetical protein [Gloeocapsopsis dulcis]WNN92084.1 hypothetical protein P0S91_25490 [Gloeocapsopsis dulcis]
MISTDNKGAIAPQENPSDCSQLGGSPERDVRITPRSTVTLPAAEN